MKLWQQNFEKMRTLERGWDGYKADPPSPGAIDVAYRLVEILEANSLSPTRVSPSVVGGVGITVRVGAKYVYLETCSDGVIHALFSADGDAKNCMTCPMELEDQEIIVKIKAYLNREKHDKWVEEMREKFKKNPPRPAHPESRCKICGLLCKDHDRGPFLRYYCPKGGIVGYSSFV